jgi:hypothetical protein
MVYRLPKLKRLSYLALCGPPSRIFLYPNHFRCADWFGQAFTFGKKGGLSLTKNWRLLQGIATYSSREMEQCEESDFLDNAV